MYYSTSTYEELSIYTLKFMKNESKHVVSDKQLSKTIAE